MKKLFVLSGFIFLATNLYSQSSEPGEVYGKVFSNFHHTVQGEKETAFEVTRAYLGYDHQIDSRFSGHIKIDIGSPDGQSVYALLKRYAYFKNAYLQYQDQGLEICFGLVDNFQYKMQEKFWGHRYIYKSFMNKHDFGTSADIGVTISYTLSEKLSMDFGVVNGEGYNSLQTDNAYLTEAAITFMPASAITLRAFYSISNKEVTEQTMAFFTGISITEKIKLGGELNYKENMSYNLNHNALGYSAYASYDLTDQWQVFSRFDKLTSETIPGDEIPWNIGNDGSAVISGVQYRPIPDIALAINYQDWVPWASNLENEAFIYFNLLFEL